jgi:hypothetical protein
MVAALHEESRGRIKKAGLYGILRRIANATFDEGRLLES